MFIEFGCRQTGIAALLMLLACQTAFSTQVTGNIVVERGLNLIAPPDIPAVESSVLDLWQGLGGPETIKRIEWLGFDAAEAPFYLICGTDAQGQPMVDACSEPVLPGQAWFVHALESFSVPIDVDIECPSWDLKAGPNLVSFPCAADGLSAVVLLYGITLSDTSKAAALHSFEPSTGRWTSLTLTEQGDFVGHDFTLVPGVGYILDLRSADQLNDRDGDGLRDERETALGYDPTLPDSDGNGIIDGLELYIALDDQDPDSDPDGDKLGTRSELLIYHTDPRNHDTDGDGFNDGDEVGDGSDPNDKNSIPALVWGDQPTWYAGSFTVYSPVGGTDPVTGRFTSAIAPGFSIHNDAADPIALGQSENRVYAAGFSLRNDAADPIALGQGSNRVFAAGFSVYNGAPPDTTHFFSSLTVNNLAETVVAPTGGAAIEP